MQNIKKFIKAYRSLYLILKPIVTVVRYAKSWFIFLFFGLIYNNGLFLSDEMKRLYAFKNKHIGERCFVIGNGPSLNAKDLEKISREYSFCSNKIYKIFEHTSFRPSFYSMQDDLFFTHLDESGDHYYIEALKHISCPIFFLKHHKIYLKNVSTYNKFFFINALHGFRASHMLLGGYWASRYTVTVFLLELAMYMGFKKIYLLGVDNTIYNLSNTEHFEGHGGLEDFTPELEIRIKTNNFTKGGLKKGTHNEYTQLMKYANKRGIKIINATRGGELEAFPRVDFDSLFNKE